MFQHLLHIYKCFIYIYIYIYKCIYIYILVWTRTYLCAVYMAI